MMEPGGAELLRIYIGEKDKHEGKPLYRAIVEMARDRGLAGATVLRGMLGFGASSRIHSSRVLRTSDNLPIVIEIVDKQDRIKEILPDLESMIVKGRLITLEKIRVVAYKHTMNNETE